MTKPKMKDSLKAAVDEPGVRKPTGQFVKGHPGFPHVLPPLISFRRVVHELSLEKTKLTPEQVVLAIYRVLLRESLRGNLQACQMLIDRLCQAEDKHAPVVLNQVNVSLGPPVPSSREFAVSLESMDEIVKELRAEDIAMVDRAPAPETNGNGHAP